jgi:hypothetical protein
MEGWHNGRWRHRTEGSRLWRHGCVVMAPADSRVGQQCVRHAYTTGVPAARGPPAPQLAQLRTSWACCRWES